MKKNFNLNESLENLNKLYKKDAKYSFVASAIKETEQGIHDMNVEKHNATFEACATFAEYLKNAKHKDMALKLDSKEKSFKTVEHDTIVSVTAYTAYRNANHTKDGKGDILPSNFRDNVKLAMATLAAAVAANTDGVNLEMEMKRIEKRYNVKVEQASKKFARTVLYSLANSMVQGIKISGADLTKVMLSVFTVDSVTWKVKLPREDTLYKVFTAMMYSILTRGEVDDSIFEVVETENA